MMLNVNDWLLPNPKWTKENSESKSVLDWSELKGFVRKQNDLMKSNKEERAKFHATINRFYKLILANCGEEEEKWFIKSIKRFYKQYKLPEIKLQKWLE